MNILGVESSCDDTAAAVLADGKILSSVVASQDEIHRQYGGVVPELASRSHLQRIMPIIQEALAQAQLGLDAIDGIAATCGPGLIGSLLVGLSVAKSIAYARRLPFAGVNHLEGHLLSAQLEHEVPFPFVGLLVSGGDTSLYHATGYGEYRFLGSTRDDAAGEAFDKAARVLGLGYPGGRLIDDLARRGDPRAVAFPRARLKPRRGREALLEFSFSGLKTAVWQYVRDHPLVGEAMTADIAASFQAAVVDMLLDKTRMALEQTGCAQLVIAGGVSANSELRARAAALGAALGVRVVTPSLRFCTDNAAMIAHAGRYRLERGDSDPLSLNATADFEL